MKIDYSELENIKHLHLPDILQNYGINLKPNGSKESFQCLCPFHADKNPSLHINRKNGKWLWNCFGCRSSGNVLDFVIKYEKLSFADAYTKLSEGRGRKDEGRNYKATATTEAKEVFSFNLQEILKQVVKHYHETFTEDKRGLEYLAGRGLKDAEIYKTFNIGFVNGSLKKTLPEYDDNELTRALISLGVLNAKGNEHFYNCVVFPIYDENNCIVGMYGRSMLANNQSHLYLPGEHKGVFNWHAIKASNEIVLTESIIDALSCYVSGVRNVIPLYGVNGLTEEHLRLFREHRTEKISLCFDNDTAGQEARGRIKEKIEPLGIEVKDVFLPAEFKDTNEALQKGFAVEEFKKLFLPFTIHSSSFTVVRTDESIQINFGARKYRIKGLSNKNLEHLRVNIKIQYGEAYHLDTLDLYSSKSRAAFINQARKLMQVKEEELTKELNRIIGELEKLQGQGTAETKNEGRGAMDEKDKEQATTCLKSKTLIEDIKKDLEYVGYVGEEANKVLGYLVSISRKLEEPLSCVIISQSSAGKSVLAETIEKLVPPEECLMFSRITPQALYYMDKDALKRKLLIIEERCGAEGADYSIRTLQSKKKLTQAVPIKDPNTGKIRTVSFEVEGPVAYIETTTKPRINEENATRCFELYLDESKEQTSRIHEAQRESKTLDGLNNKYKREFVTIKHQNMQRCLREIKVVNPFAHLLDFPVEWLRTRRDHLRFLNLIEVVTFLYQHQREINKSNTGQEYIESSVEDYSIAYNLAKEVLGESFTELKKPQRELLFKIEEMLNEKDEVGRREIRERVGLGDRRLRDLLTELVELEYLEVCEGKQGKAMKYRLAERMAVNDKIISGLTKPEILAEKLKKCG